MVSFLFVPGEPRRYPDKIYFTRVSNTPWEPLMNDSLFATVLVSIVLVALSVNATPASAQEPEEKIPEEVLAAFRDASKLPQTKKPEATPAAGAVEVDGKAARVVFDAERMTSTVELLSKAYHVDYEETPLNVLLRKLAERSGVEFRNNVSKQSLVTFKTTASFGTMLGDLLASVGCEYAILPNGTIEVRYIPNPAEKR